MPPVGFEPTISAGERPQTYALDRAATGTGGLSPVKGYKFGLGTQTRSRNYFPSLPLGIAKTLSVPDVSTVIILKNLQM